MNPWSRYWFAAGGRLAAAVVRIALACAVLMSLARLSTLPPLAAPAELYRPVGPWMLLGATPPPAALVDALWWLAWGGTVAMLLGVFARASTVVSCVAGVALAALSFSGNVRWSHQYNVVFLAQLAFLGARGGDVLSVDALIRRARGLPAVDVPGGYQWSLRLVQLAVALMFSSAALHKIGAGHGTLRWALSDNLRHHLLVHYDLAGVPRPALVSWLLEDVWRYRGAALLNLISQAAPIGACIWVRRPWVRAACGALFAIEIVALAGVVNLWNPHWLPLVAVFVDWDALARWARRRGAAPVAARAGAPPRRSRATHWFIAVFLAYTALTSFVPGLDQRLNTYPFSSFPMFAKIRATAPYDQHLPYVVVGDHVEVLGGEVDAIAQIWLDHNYRGLYKERDPGRFRARLASILADTPALAPDVGKRGLRHYLTMFEAPAYPAPARFERHLIAITAELGVDGQYRSLLGGVREAGGGFELELPPGVEPASVTLVAYHADRVAPVPVATIRIGARFVVPWIDGHPLYLVAIVDGTPWLVATRS